MRLNSKTKTAQYSVFYAGLQAHKFYLKELSNKIKKRTLLDDINASIFLLYKKHETNAFIVQRPKLSI